MKVAIRNLARRILGDYAWYRIYARDTGDAEPAPPKPAGIRFATVDQTAVASSADPSMAEQAWYGGPESHLYAGLSGPRIVALCCFWHGERYRARNFWPLGDGEAKLVHVITLPELRGRGIAAGLIAFAARDMAARRFHRLYARIWHSNVASRRAFVTAGWTHAATVFEAFPFGGSRPLRFTLTARRNRARRDSPSSAGPLS